MAEGKPGKQYDFEERTFGFSRSVRSFVRQLPRTLSNIEDVKLFGRVDYDEPLQSICPRADIRLGFEPSRRFTIGVCFGFRASDFGFG